MSISKSAIPSSIRCRSATNRTKSSHRGPDYSLSSRQAFSNRRAPSGQLTYNRVLVEVPERKLKHVQFPVCDYSATERYDVASARFRAEQNRYSSTIQHLLRRVSEREPDEEIDGVRSEEKGIAVAVMGVSQPWSHMNPV